MTVQQEILPPEGQEIIDRVAADPKSSFTRETLEKLEPAVLKLAEPLAALDMNKSADRQQNKTFCSNIQKLTAALDRTRLDMTAELRAQVSEINEIGNSAIAKLKAVREQVRAPLTAWEDAEKKREELVETTIARIKAAALVTISDTAASVSARGNEIYEIEIDPEVFRKRTDEALDAMRATLDALEKAKEILVANEEREAKLAAMEAAEAERLAKEAEELRQREAAEAAARAEQEAKERGERLKQEAADKARRDAEQAAEQARLAAEREAQRQIDEANERAAAAERAAQAERDRIAAEKAEEQRLADAQAAEQARRERNAAHRRKIMGTVKQSIMEVGGITEEAAMAIVRAMAKGNVPHVTVQF